MCVRTPEFCGDDTVVKCNDTDLKKSTSKRNMMCVCYLISVCPDGAENELIVTVSPADNLSFCHVHIDTCIHTWSPGFSLFWQSLYDKVCATLHSSPFIRIRFGPVILWDSLAPLPFHSPPSVSLMVCLLALSLPIPDITQGELSLMLRNPLCWFLSNTNLFCLYSVLPRASAVPMNTSQAATETTLCAICNPREVSLSKHEQAMASLPPYNEQI